MTVWHGHGQDISDWQSWWSTLKIQLNVHWDAMKNVLKHKITMKDIVTKISLNLPPTFHHSDQCIDHQHKNQFRILRINSKINIEIGSLAHHSFDNKQAWQSRFVWYLFMLLKLQASFVFTNPQNWMIKPSDVTESQVCSLHYFIFCQLRSSSSLQSLEFKMQFIASLQE